ncbi:MAG: hypothetical protein HYV97_08490 [Bdellovibrio sp.]|nr:hypothetical protein [Bdellovibrio sp.]
MLKSLFTIFLLAFHSGVQAGNVPTGVLDLDSLMFEFRGKLERKIQGLFENYIATSNRSQTIFSSSEQVECSHQMIAKGRPLAVIEYHFEVKPDELVERLRYTDCFRTTGLNEMIITKGQNLRALNQAELRSGRRSFELSSNEIEKRYVLTNDNNEELVSLMVYRQNNNLRAFIRLRGSRFLDMARELEEERERYVYTLSGYDIEYKTAFASWHSRMNMPVTTYSALRLKSETNDIVHYLDSQNQPISMQEFQAEFGRVAVDGGLRMVGQFMEYHLYTFPPTDFSRSTVQKNRFIEELNLAYIQLLNNTDLNLVTNFIRAIIDAIAQGLIRVEDHRPKTE